MPGQWTIWKTLRGKSSPLIHQPQNPRAQPQSLPCLSPYNHLSLALATAASMLCFSWPPPTLWPLKIFACFLQNVAESNQELILNFSTEVCSPLEILLELTLLDTGEIKVEELQSCISNPPTVGIIPKLWIKSQQLQNPFPILPWFSEQIYCSRW